VTKVAVELVCAGVKLDRGWFKAAVFSAVKQHVFIRCSHASAHAT